MGENYGISGMQFTRKKFNIEREALKRVINNLKIYTYTHFTMEEELMLMASYTDFSNHKKEHKKFIDRIVLTFSSNKKMTVAAWYQSIGKKTTF